MNIKDIKLAYSSKSCSLYDYKKWHKKVSYCPDFSSIPVIIYLNKCVNEIKLSKKDLQIDNIISEVLLYGWDYSFVAIKIVLLLNLREVNDFLPKIFASTNEDEKSDLFFEFIKNTKGIEW